MPECIFCGAGREELPTGIKICELTYSRLYLFREQRYVGRCLLASKSHVPEIYDMPPEEQNGFLAELTAVSRTLQELYGMGRHVPLHGKGRISLGAGIPKPDRRDPRRVRAQGLPLSIKNRKKLNFTAS
mgnify:CR=1 FL=1